MQFLITVIRDIKNNMRIAQDPLADPTLLQEYVYRNKETLLTVIQVTWHRVVHFFKTGEWLNHAKIIDALRDQILPVFSERAAHVGRCLAEKEWKCYVGLLLDSSLTTEQRQRLEALDVRAHAILFVDRSEYTISLNDFEHRFGLNLPEGFADMPALLATEKERFLEMVVAQYYHSSKGPKKPPDASPEEILFVEEMDRRLYEARERKK